MKLTEDENHVDDDADKEILECLDLGKPKSFFLYAGAGSGKTRSLVEAIRYVCRHQGQRLSISGQQIAVITYTNAACDEIKQRLEFNPLVEVQTIHSFAWSLIKGYDTDIRNWVALNLKEEIAELEQQQAKGRASKASTDRARSIISKQRRLDGLNKIRKFIYSPTGDNRTRDALNHSEVIAMTANFLKSKKALQRLLVSRYPILLIDESQDTNSRLMDAMLHVQAAQGETFCLGLFGDTMQRIYNDGKVGLAKVIPPDWATPEKIMNHRCPNRVINLINKIRSTDDGKQQRGRSDKPNGHARIFILQENTVDKFAAEEQIAHRMAVITGDESWKSSDSVKTLTLEHHMAARRFGFEKFFEALYPVERLRTGLLDGTLPGVTLFTKDVLPVAKALAARDQFLTAAVVRSRSPLLAREHLLISGENQLNSLRTAKAATESLSMLCAKEGGPTLLEVLMNVAESGLFEIPESIKPFATRTDSGLIDQAEVDDLETRETEVVAWRSALETPFAQIAKYNDYVNGLSKFDTHQGVKGLEFPRVMVVISDDEARGFLFSYEKLFGAKEKSKTDEDNIATGKETTIDRTRRLLYVTCSRAEESLAIVYYSNDPLAVKKCVIERGWFDESEVELL